MSSNERAMPRPIPPQPLAAVMLAVSAGIGLDRIWPRPLALWLTFAIVFASTWLVFWIRRHDRLALVMLLAGCATVGAGWHHCRWHLFDRQEIGLWADEQPQAVCLDVISIATVRQVPAAPREPLSTVARGPRSRLTVRARRLRLGDHWQAVTGRAELLVEGQLLDVLPGDELRVYARLAAPPAAINPGQFDLTQYLRARRELCQLHAASPGCIARLRSGGPWSPGRWLGRVRAAAHRTLEQQLEPHHAPLAAALLLGTRDALDDATSDAFFLTGTVHLLAISGLHVGILAAGFWLAARLCCLQRRTTLVLVASTAIFYAALTEARPPVMRATLLIVVLCLARLLGRRALSTNTLSAAALVVLIASPASLFQTGAQLSFLAVAVLAHLHRHRHRKQVDPLDRLIRQSRPWPLRAARGAAQQLLAAWTTTAAVWLAALPLVMARFHVVAPAAIGLNPLLWLPVATALYSGFGVLLLAWLLPPAGQLCARLCELSLTAMEAVVGVVHDLPPCYFWTAGPAPWWIAGFYLALGAVLLAPRLCPPRRWTIAMLALWTALGLWVPHLTSSEQTALQATFIAVGHGTCVLIRLPDGRHLLYDAGRLGPPRGGVELISGVLWQRGVRHLDAVVVSHADADHFNALPGLLDRFPASVVYVAPQMFQHSSPALDTLHAAIVQSGAQLEMLVAGDRLQAGPHAAIQVLHPPAPSVTTARHFAHTAGGDNANSIVLSIECSGRDMLLSGDLEAAGIDQLLARPPRDYDVLQVPHHGSPRSRPADVARWATPDVAIICGGSGRDTARTERAYREVGSRVLHTARDGCVTVRFICGR